MIKDEELLNFPLFAGMTVATRRWVSERIHRVQVHKGAYVFMEGDACDALYIIEKGSVRVFKSLDSGRELTLDVFYAADAIGEVALLDDTTFPATALAIEDSTILKLPKVDYQTLLTQRPDAPASIIRDLLMRIRSLNRRVQELGSGEVEQRLALVVLSIAERSNAVEKDLLVCELSRQEMASMIGARMETVIRTISRWYKLGVAVKSQTGLHIRKQALSDLIREKFKEADL